LSGGVNVDADVEVESAAAKVELATSVGDMIADDMAGAVNAALTAAGVEVEVAVSGFAVCQDSGECYTAEASTTAVPHIESSHGPSNGPVSNSAIRPVSSSAIRFSAMKPGLSLLGVAFVTGFIMA